MQTLRQTLLWLADEIGQLTRFNRSDRHWLMPLAASLACGLPMLVGAVFGRMDYGVISALAGMVFLYLPEIGLNDRMVWLMSCAFGMVSCYALGLLCHLVPELLLPALVFISILVTIMVRLHRMGPPGPTFFVMAATVGAYSPTGMMDVPLKVGLFALGCLLACLVAFAYSLVSPRLYGPKPQPAAGKPEFGFVVLDPVVIGVFVGLSLALAQMLHLVRPYWVPVSCLAVIQGMSLRAVWTRQIHRIGGTVLGMGVTWALLALPLDKWSVTAMVIILTFIIESTVVRHYGLAVVFITPVTIFLAEAATLGQGSATEVIQARMIDTALGSVIGLIGGLCLHNLAIRGAVERLLRRVLPLSLAE